MPEVRLDGVWLGSIGHVSDVAWSSRWGTGPSGPFEASCAVAIEPSNDTTLLRLNRTMEVWRDNGTLAFSGPVVEVGRGYPRTLHAKGWSRLAADFDSDSLTVSTAVTNAIARGLRWTNNAFPATVLGDGINDVPPRLDVLLNQWADMTGNRWGANELRQSFVATDPTAVRWFLDAADLDISVAADGLFTAVRARYVSAVAGTPSEPTAWGVQTATSAVGSGLYGAIEYPMDLTPLGLITSGTALSYATQQLAQLTRPQWLSSAAVTSRQLLNPNGHRADLQAVEAGQVVKLFNVPNRLGGLSDDVDLTVVLGEVSHGANPDEITIAPLTRAVSNLADLAEKKFAAMKKTA